MQITLNVEGSQLDAEVREIIKSLTPEQKFEMAKDVVAKNLEKAKSELNVQAARDAAIEEWNSKNPEKLVKYEDGKWLIQDSYKRYGDPYYREKEELENLVKKHTYTYEYYRNHILAAMLEDARKQITEAVQSSTLIQESIEKVKKEIEESFPKIVHDAIVLHFCAGMQNLATSVAQSMFQIKNQGDLLQQIRSKIG